MYYNHPRFLWNHHPHPQDYEALTERERKTEQGREEARAKLPLREIGQVFDVQNFFPSLSLSKVRWNEGGETTTKAYRLLLHPCKLKRGMACYPTGPICLLTCRSSLLIICTRAKLSLGKVMARPRDWKWPPS